MLANTVIKVSIITPMLNEESNLTILYESIMQQIFPSYISIAEIIAVDNGSTDNSVAIASRYCSNVYIRPDDTIAELRNYGASHSSGDILIYLDADCILGNDVIHNVVTLLDDNMATALGPDGFKPIGNSTWVQNTWYLHLKVLGIAKQSIEVENLSSGFFAIKARDFARVGGFNGFLTIGEDTDISRKLRAQGYKLIKSNKLRVFNSRQPKTIKEFVKREYWHGDSFCHLLIHKKMEKLTIYFLVNIVIILIFCMLIIYRMYSLALIVFALSCAAPLLKAVKKVSKLNIDTIRLFYIYLLYIHTRTVALFKLK